MIENAEEVGLSLQEYQLPHELRDLTKITKKQTTKHDTRFKRLFRDLKERKAAKITTLARWIAYLKEHNYASDLNELVET